MYILGVEAFWEIVRTQSITKAAENLHLSQSTLSYRLKILEEEMGYTLIERSKGVAAVHLTSMGESFINIAERWRLLLEETDYLKIHGPKTFLSIGAIDSLNNYVLPPFFQAICKRPDLSIRIGIHNSWELYDLLEMRDISVGFVAMEMSKKNIEIKPFYKDALVILCRADSHINSSLVESMQLNTEDEFLINFGPAFRKWHDQWWDPLKPARITLNTLSTLCSILSDSQHWAIVPLSMATILARTGAYNYFYLPISPPERTYYMITHKHPDTKTVRMLSALDEYVALVANIE